MGAIEGWQWVHEPVRTLTLGLANSEEKPGFAVLASHQILGRGEQIQDGVAHEMQGSPKRENSRHGTLATGRATSVFGELLCVQGRGECSSKGMG